MVSELQQLHAAGEEELGLERTEMIEKLDNIEKRIQSLDWINKVCC